MYFAAAQAAQPCGEDWKVGMATAAIMFAMLAGVALICWAVGRNY